MLCFLNLGFNIMFLPMLVLVLSFEDWYNKGL